MQLFQVAKKPKIHRVGVKEFCPWCNGIICQKDKKRPVNFVTQIDGTEIWIHRQCYIASTLERK